MARFRLKRYLGIVFISVVIAPAVILSLVALRAVKHEEAYIEKQIEGTLSAEVAHVSGVIVTELDNAQSELAGTVVLPETPDAGEAFEAWKRRSTLVDVPFLLSPSHEILWPAARVDDGKVTVGEYKTPADKEEAAITAEETFVAGERATLAADRAVATLDDAPTTKESSFLETQQAFLRNEEETPIYRNIADAYKDDILEDAPGIARAEAELDLDEPVMLGDSLEVTEEMTLEGYVAAGRVKSAESEAPSPARTEDRSDAAGEVTEAEQSPHPESRQQAWYSPSADETRRQAAISQFEQSEGARKRVYEKAQAEGQQLSYRNVLTEAEEDAEEPKTASREEEALGVRQLERSLSAPAGAAQEKKADRLTQDPDRGGAEPGKEERISVIAGAADAADAPPEDERAEPHTSTPSEPEAPASKPDPESIGRVRSIFIAQPQSFSDIVAKGESGIIPRTVDGSLELLYWRRALDGSIVGCLINSDELRDLIVGALPGIYSSVRILTVLDEGGLPLVIPPGHGDRDWQRPFVAEEISEILPRWEVAAYLTDPNVISSRAQVATSLMWVLIVILFVAIVVGGTMVVRSTYAEMRLAQQKTSFVANVSHELKTPLTSIRLFAEMLRDGRQRDEEKQKEYLSIMTAETERLTRLVNNVLDFSRMERGEKRYDMRRCNLVEVCAGVVESQRARLENNGFDVVLMTHAGTLIAQADEEAIKQAVVNLLSNAEKYSSDAKQIGIEVRRDDDKAVIGISDRGPGIPANEAERIFDEFYRVDDALTSKVKGAGLGLTIARRIARDHGGDIRYLRREGGGSTFEIVIPLAKEEQ